MSEHVRAAFARTGLAIFSRLVPRRHDDWRAAMLGEYWSLSPELRPRWLLGLMFAACRLRASEPHAFYAIAASAAMTSLVAVDWSTANDTVALAALLSSATFLGFLRPRHLKLSALLIGTVLLVAHALANFTGRALPFYQCKPLTAREFLILALLVFPAIAGANAGAAVRQILRSKH